jgi:fructose-1,6-bisphosphatase
MTMEKNPLGKELADIDIKADEIIFSHLEKSKVVHSAMSNNRPSVNVLNEGAEYIVTFDPIDGSHVIDSNFSISSVYAIWQCTDINGKTGRDLVGACMAIYGSRTTIVVYNNQSQKVEELTLLKMGPREKWIVTNPHMQIRADAKIFSPALRSSYDHPEYLKLFEELCIKGYSIRYSSCTAVDCYQQFVKGHGCFSMIDSVTHPSRIHLIYEAIPIAFLIEKAGGKTSDLNQSILDVKITGYDQRTSLVCGSSNDVDHVIKTLGGTS